MPTKLTLLEEVESLKKQLIASEAQLSHARADRDHSRKVSENKAVEIIRLQNEIRGAALDLSNALKDPTALNMEEMHELEVLRRTGA